MNLRLPSAFAIAVSIAACSSQADDVEDAASEVNESAQASATCPTRAFTKGGGAPQRIDLRNFKQSAEGVDGPLMAFHEKLKEGCAQHGITDRDKPGTFTCDEELYSDATVGFGGACLDMCEGSKLDELHGLTQLSIAGLNHYTSNGYDGINEALWSNDVLSLDDFNVSLSFAIASALNALPAYEGAVQRGELQFAEGMSAEARATVRAKAKQRFDGIVQRKDNGEPLTVPAFWSTTTNPELWYVSQGALVYVIRKSRSGRSVVSASGYSEDEVLFPPCTSFDIVDTEEIEDPSVPGEHKFRVTLEER